MVAQGSGLFYDILSSNLLVDAALRHYFSFKLIYVSTISVFSEKSVSELGPSTFLRDAFLGTFFT